VSLNVALEIGSNYPVLSEYMQCRERVSLIRGPRGSAKTFSTAQRILQQMTEQEPNDRGERRTRWMVSRDSYTELTTTTIKDFQAVFRDLDGVYHPHGVGGNGPPTWITRPQTWLSDGSMLVAEVIFQSAGVDDAEERIKGYQLTGAWFNELSGCRKGPWDTARAGVGRYPSGIDGGVTCTWRGMIGDTNSFDESHWLHPIFQAPPAGWRCFNQPGGVLYSGQIGPDGRKVWLDNPDAENLANLPEGYYRDLVHGADDGFISVLLANEYGFYVEGKPVHPRYVDTRHCSAPVVLEPDPKYPLVIGLDFGRTPAAVIAQHLTHIGRWHVLDELVSDDMSAALFGPELKRKLEREYSGYRVMAYGDPAGDSRGQATEHTPIQMIQASGVPCMPAPSNIPALRRAAIDNPLMRVCADQGPAFLVSPKAKNFRKAMQGGWCYRKLRVQGTERYDEAPDKGPLSHVGEAGEYAFLGGGEGRAALRPAEPQMQHRGLRQTRAISEWAPEGEWG